MGKIRTRVLGMEEVEKEQKKKQKERSVEKKAKKTEAASEPEKEKKVNVEPVQEEPEKAKKEKKEKKQVSSKKRGGKYQKSYTMRDKTKTYTLKEAVELVKKMKYTSFDESVELHLNVDETGLKGEVELPFSTGKTTRVVIVSDEVLADIEKGKLNFDVLVTHPSFMPKLARFAKVLGPKGLMPNPKAGTISPKPEEVVKKFAKGNLRWKTEAKFPLIHQMIGKVSHDDKNLVANAQALINSVGSKHIKKAFIKSTMSPSVTIQMS